MHYILSNITGDSSAKPPASPPAVAANEKQTIANDTDSGSITAPPITPRPDYDSPLLPRRDDQVDTLVDMSAAIAAAAAAATSVDQAPRSQESLPMLPVGGSGAVRSSPFRQMTIGERLGDGDADALNEREEDDAALLSPSDDEEERLPPKTAFSNERSNASQTPLLRAMSAHECEDAAIERVEPRPTRDVVAAFTIVDETDT